MSIDPSLLPRNADGLSQSHESAIRELTRKADQVSVALKPYPRYRDLPTEIRQATAEIKVERGWLQDTLARNDGMYWGRWRYWLEGRAESSHLHLEHIPWLDWTVGYDPSTTAYTRELINALFPIFELTYRPQREHLEYLFDFLLYSFGYEMQTTQPVPPPGSEGASVRLVALLQQDLFRLQLYPQDYFAALLVHFLAEDYGYLREHTIEYYDGLVQDKIFTQFKVTDDNDPEHEQPDPFTHPTHPRFYLLHHDLVKTGASAIAASNYTLRMRLGEVDPLLAKATLCNLYLYAPWYVKLNRRLGAGEYPDGSFPWGISFNLDEIYRKKEEDPQFDFDKAAEEYCLAGKMVACISDSICQQTFTKSEKYNTNRLQRTTDINAANWWRYTPVIVREPIYDDEDTPEFVHSFEQPANAIFYVS